ncbi:hypothetical protein HK102_004656 [Quaeritorhiza haematococci]|nr:hypothetical protein HK102_004656 [Quaeritorhiza haematococci]
MHKTSIILFGLLASVGLCEAGGGGGGGNRPPPNPPLQGNVVSNTLEEYIHEFGTPNQNHDLNCPPGTFITDLCGTRFVRISDRFQTFGLRTVSLTCSDGSRVDPFGIGTGERCLSKPGTGFTQIGIGHGGNIDRIRDTTMPDGQNPPNFIGNFGGDIHNLVAGTGMKLTGVTIGYKPNDGLAYYFRFTFRDVAFDDGVCLDPSLFRRSFDLDTVEQTQPAAPETVTTELAVRSTKRNLTRITKRAFTVQVAITVAKFLCNALVISLTKAQFFGSNCAGKRFLGGVPGKDDTTSIHAMIAAFGCNLAGNLVEIAASGTGRVILEDIGGGVRKLCGAIFHIGNDNGFRACNFS